MILKTLTIKSRLILLITLLSFLLLAVGALGLSSLSATNTTLKVVFEHNVKTLKTLERMVSLINRNQILVLEAFSGQASEFPEEIEQVDERVILIKDGIQVIDDLYQAYKANAMSEEELALIENFDKARIAYGMEGLMPAVAALVAHDFEQVGELLQGPMREFYPDVRDSAEALIALQQDTAGGLYKNAQERHGFVKMISIVVIAGGVLLAVIIGFMVIRAISAPLTEAVSVATSVSNGDLTRKIEVRHQDETGLLMEAMRRMNKGLYRIVCTVRNSTCSIENTSRNLAEGNASLSERTEQQVETLREASSSLKDLTVTVKANAKSAVEANEVVQASAEIAKKGGTIVEEAVTKMASIKESSNRIKDIVGVIDSISFQTNLLALNAAVEAARAGEQGKGFAVVAGEVRNLAQRCAEAAREIQGLIDESVLEVDAGSALVNTTGDAMKDIVESVTGVTELMHGIASASQQQSVGIEQVNVSVGNMDQITLQNADMVKEAASSAEDLLKQAHQLAEAVSVFRLDETSTNPFHEYQHSGAVNKTSDIPGTVATV